MGLDSRCCWANDPFQTSGIISQLARVILLDGPYTVSRAIVLNIEIYTV